MIHRSLHCRIPSSDIPSVADVCFLSSGNSNTHRNLESINSSGFTSFHCNKTYSLGPQLCHRQFFEFQLTNCSELNSPSGATRLWTINLCLFFSFGSKSNGCKQTVIKKKAKIQVEMNKSHLAIVVANMWFYSKPFITLTSNFYKIVWL